MLLHLRKIAIFSLQIFLYHLQLCTLCIIQVNLAFAVVLEIKPNAEPSGQVVISVILTHQVFCDFIRVSLRGDIFHSCHCDTWEHLWPPHHPALFPTSPMRGLQEQMWQHIVTHGKQHLEFQLEPEFCTSFSRLLHRAVFPSGEECISGGRRLLCTPEVLFARLTEKSLEQHMLCLFL